MSMIHLASGRSPIMTELSVGNPLSVESLEAPIFEYQIKNDANEEKVGASATITMRDSTQGSEDVDVKEYRRVGGNLLLWRSSKIYSEPPSGVETPSVGCQVFADRVTWDPLSKGSGGAYLTMYLGASSGWGAITAQLD